MIKRKILRISIIEILKNKLNDYGLNYNDYSFQIGGSTSIDINPKDEFGNSINKGHAILKLSKHFNINVNKILYIGDDMSKGGNDGFVRNIPNLNAIEVDGIIENILKDGKKTIPDTLKLLDLLIK